MARLKKYPKCKYCGSRELKMSRILPNNYYCRGCNRLLYTKKELIELRS